MNKFTMTLNLSKEELKAFGMLCFLNAQQTHTEIGILSKKIYGICKNSADEELLIFWEMNEPVLAAIAPGFANAISENVDETVEDFISIRKGMDSAGDQSKHIVDKS